MQMDAETAGMDADTSETHSSRRRERRSSFFEKTAPDGANGVPSGSYFRKSSL
jgi:hypothetical protein